MERSSMLRTRCIQLLAINRALFDSSHPRAAYYALEAAIQCAADCGDTFTIHHAKAAAADQQRQLTERVMRSSVGISSTEDHEVQRWANLAGLYAIAVRQARFIAQSLDPHTASDSEC